MIIFDIQLKSRRLFHIDFLSKELLVMMPHENMYNNYYIH